MVPSSDLRVGFKVESDRALKRLRRLFAGTKASAQVCKDIAAWEAWVVTSMRRKMRFDSQRPIHGHVIAFMLRQAGYPAFKYDSRVLVRARTIFAAGLRPVKEKAYFTGRADYQDTKKAFLAVADFLAETSVNAIRKGDLGTPSAKMGRMKTRLQAKGRATKKFGTPPPIGILSGRFIEGIKGRAVRPRRTVG